MSDTSGSKNIIDGLLEEISRNCELLKIAYFDGHSWTVCGLQGKYNDLYFKEIDERPITREEIKQ